MSTNKEARLTSVLSSQQGALSSSQVTAKRGRGRPPGTRNKTTLMAEAKLLSQQQVKAEAAAESPVSSSNVTTDGSFHLSCHMTRLPLLFLCSPSSRRASPSACPSPRTCPPCLPQCCPSSRNQRSWRRTRWTLRLHPPRAWSSPPSLATLWAGL